MSAAPPPITTIAAMTPTMTKMIVLLLPLSLLPAGAVTFGVEVELVPGEPLVAGDVGAAEGASVGWMAGFGT